MLYDLRYAIRMLLKSPGFTTVAVLSLALGIGANTALFSVLDAVLLKTLPVKEPESLVLFSWESGRPFRTSGMRGSFMPTPPGTRGAAMFRHDIYEALQKARAEISDGPLTDFFAFAPIMELTVVTNQQAEVVSGQAVSGGYYAGLGVTPILGRGIFEKDDDPGAPPVAVLSHQYWQQRLGGNAKVIGQQIKLNEAFFTIVGVTPPDFTGTLQVEDRPAVTIPIAFEQLLLGDDSAMPRGGRPGVWWLSLMGRLKPGATIEQAQQSLASTFQAAALEIMPPPRRASDVATLDPKDYPHLMAQIGSRGLMEHRVSYSSRIYPLFGVAAIVLLIACGNVSNLLLVRAAKRSSEISVRLAVGASRAQLLRQLLTESVLLACLGGAVGVLFALWGIRALLALAGDQKEFLPTTIQVSLDWRMLAFAFGVSLLTGIFFGLLPALRATRLNLVDSIKQSRRNAGTGSKLTKGLVAVQMALSVLLLVGAGLFIRTLGALQNVNLGFNQDNLLLFSVQPGQAGYKDARLVQFYQQLSERLEALPGVRSASFARIPLIAQYEWNTNVLLPGEANRGGDPRMANRQSVRANYFSTMEIALRTGRGFTDSDSSGRSAVAIVNETFVKKYLPNVNAVGQRIVDTDGNREFEIVGIVADTKYSSQRTEMEPLLYTHWLQEPAGLDGVFFALRSSGDPAALAVSARRMVEQLDANLPVRDLDTQEARANQTIGTERLFARLLSFFGAVSLGLTAIGLSGVLAYSVAQRTNEIGVRMALGAQRGDVLRQILGRGMALAGLGVGLGLIGAATTTHLLKSLLYGVSPLDPVAFLGISALLMGVSMLACWLPAWRASRVDPMVALRSE